MEAPHSDARAPVLRLAVALPLACAVLIGSLWLGEQLRTYRAGDVVQVTPEPASQAGAAPGLFQQPMQFVSLPAGLASGSSGSPSPDGAYLIARTADFRALAVVRVTHELDVLNLKSEIASTLPDLSFIAWLPDSKAFLAQSTKVLDPVAGAKPQMKTYAIFRVTPDGITSKIGEALGGPFALSVDGKQLAAFDGEPHLVVIAVDGSRTRRLDDPTAGSAPALLGWDAQGAIVRADYREPFSLWRIPTTGGTPAQLRPQGVRSVSNARWSPEHRNAIVTVTTATGERDGLLTDVVRDQLPAEAFPAWVSPNRLLTRASDEHAGTVDVPTGSRSTLNAKMRSAKIRILAIALPFVLWLDETNGVPHLLDFARDADTAVGFDPGTSRAEPLSKARFYVWQADRVILLDANAWWTHYVYPTPTPIPQAKDQSGVPAGYLRVESPEGGWSIVMPKTWYRRDAPMHGSEFLSYDPQGMDSSGNVPPPGEVRVVFMMYPDYGAKDARDFAKSKAAYLAGNAVKAEADATLAGQPAYTVTAFLNNPPPFAVDARFWFLRSPYFSDRVVMIEAAPLTRSAEVDALVGSLRFFAPKATAVTPTPSRAEVIAKYSKPSYSATRVDRVEVKLVRWKDLEKAAPIGRSGVNDPDELTWVVIVYGEIQPPRGGPMRLGTSQPTATPRDGYEMHAFSATGREGGLYSCCGPEAAPSWWDRLVDLGK